MEKAELASRAESEEEKRATEAPLPVEPTAIGPLVTSPSPKQRPSSRTTLSKDAPIFVKKKAGTSSGSGAGSGSNKSEEYSPKKGFRREGFGSQISSMEQSKGSGEKKLHVFAKQVEALREGQVPADRLIRVAREVLEYRISQRDRVFDYFDRNLRKEQTFFEKTIKGILGMKVSAMYREEIDGFFKALVKYYTEPEQQQADM